MLSCQMQEQSMAKNKLDYGLKQPANYAYKDTTDKY